MDHVARYLSVQAQATFGLQARVWICIYFRNVGLRVKKDVSIYKIEVKVNIQIDRPRAAKLMVRVLFR